MEAWRVAHVTQHCFNMAPITINRNNSVQTIVIQMLPHRLWSEPKPAFWNDPSLQIPLIRIFSHVDLEKIQKGFGFLSNLTCKSVAENNMPQNIPDDLFQWIKASSTRSKKEKLKLYFHTNTIKTSLRLWEIGYLSGLSDWLIHRN